jgi:RNA polymerase sigma-70 factor (ECF subfamily)
MSSVAVDSVLNSFDSLVEPILASAFRVAIGLTRNQDDAEDLVQDAVLRAHKGFESFEYGTNFKAWFFRILFNCFRTEYRRRRRRADVVSFDEGVERHIAADAPAEVSGSFADAPDALRRLHAEQITAALRTLPEEYRGVATMYFVDDLSYQEMAEALDIPVGTVRSRLHRGRKMLQARLWSLAVDLGIVAPRATPAREGSAVTTTAVTLAHSGG